MAELFMNLFSGIGALNSMKNANEQMKWAREARRNILTNDQANEQAGKTLNPIYDKIVDRNLENLDKSNMSRGFYGQLPGDVLKRSTEGDLRNQQSAAIASLANQMVGQSRDYASSLASQALQAKQQEYNNIGNFVNTIGNSANQYYDQTGYRFGLGNLFGGLGGQYSEGSDQGYVSPDADVVGPQNPGGAPTIKSQTRTPSNVNLDLNNLNTEGLKTSPGWAPTNPTQLEQIIARLKNPNTDPWAN